MDNGERPTFGLYLTEQFLPRAVEKRLLGGRFVRFGPMMTVGLWLFETGAAVSYALRDRFHTLMTVFAQPGRESDFAAHLYRRAEERLASMPNAAHLLDFYMGSDLSDAPFTHWNLALLAWGKNKVDLSQAMAKCQQAVAEGVGFGARFPDHFASLFEKSYQVDTDTWREAHRAGLDIPAEPQEPIPLEERVHGALLNLSVFLGLYYPELLGPLGLRFGTQGQTDPGAP